MKKFKFTVSRDALDELSKDNAIAIKAFNTRNLQLAEYPCISCMKLCFKRDVTELAACKKPIEGMLGSDYKITTNLILLWMMACLPDIFVTTV